MKTFDNLNLDNFQQQYESIMLNQDTRLEYCPKKTSIHLSKENNLDTVYMNTMPAKTYKGSFVKNIYVDLKSSKNTIEDITYIQNGKPIRKTNIGLTPYRCGIISSLIIRYLLNNTNRDLTVGFIGTGNINKTIAKVITDNIKQIKHFEITSKTNSKESFDYFNSILPTRNIPRGHKWKSDIIFSCTNSTSTDFYEEEELKNTQCLVSLDGGNIFAPSTRLNRIFFSDHIEQLEDVYKTEFPYDTHKPFNVRQLDDSLYMYSKSFVNLYGIAFADAILFEQLLEKGDFNVI